MNTRRDPEAIIDEWLDEGPDRVPPITRQVILSSIQVTPQRGKTPAWLPSIPRSGVPRRYSQMSSFLRLAVASILAIVLGGSLYGGLRLSVTAPAAAPSPSASAESTPAPSIVHVSGTGSCSDEVGGTTTSLRGLMITRDATLECTTDTNDPRVSGTWTTSWNHAWSGRGPAIWWGASHLADSDGAWDCSWMLTDDPRADSFPVLNVCRGSGDYAQLTFVFQHVMGGGEPDEVLGYIYAGPPPVEFVPPAT